MTTIISFSSSLLQGKHTQLFQLLLIGPGFQIPHYPGHSPLDMLQIVNLLPKSWRLEVRQNTADAPQSNSNAAKVSYKDIRRVHLTWQPDLTVTNQMS